MISDAAAFVVRTWESTPQRLSVLRFPFFTEKKTVFKFCTNNCNYLGFQQRTIYVVSMGIDSLAYNMQIMLEHVLLILRCGFIYSSYIASPRDQRYELSTPAAKMIDGCICSWDCSRLAGLIALNSLSGPRGTLLKVKAGDEAWESCSFPLYNVFPCSHSESVAFIMSR